MRESLNRLAGFHAERFAHLLQLRNRFAECRIKLFIDVRRHVVGIGPALVGSERAAFFAELLPLLARKAGQIERPLDASSIGVGFVVVAKQPIQHRHGNSTNNRANHCANRPN